MAKDSEARGRTQGFGGTHQIDGLMGVLSDVVQEGGDPSRVLDAISQTLVMVLGSGPAFATLDSLIAANQANGLMYHNAVANQQKTNIFGMCATMKCVSALLDKPTVDMTVDIEEETE
jgi:hypothetical protein